MQHIGLNRILVDKKIYILYNFSMAKKTVRKPAAKARRVPSASHHSPNVFPTIMVGIVFLIFLILASGIISSAK